MDDKDRQGASWRRKAIRLSLKGWPPPEILRDIPRRRTWLFNCQKRFAQGGWESLKARSCRPRHSPPAYNGRARALIPRVRRSLETRRVGLSGARAVQQESRQPPLLKPVPALATINRWLHAAGVPQVPSVPFTAYYPQPPYSADAVLHALDWTARYLTGGAKVFAFPTVDAEPHALQQTLSTDKTGATLSCHVLAAWQTLGLPHGLQLDNDSACSGGENLPRRFGALIRLCLYFGIELSFTPPHEPKRNGLVESLNGLWVRSFWHRTHFRSFLDVIRQSPQLPQWYAQVYAPPALHGLTPARAQRRVQPRRLAPRQARALPQPLPLTAGRLPFIRRVAPDGTIRFLGERGKVGKRFAHHYGWATIIPHYQRLEIHHQHSERSALRLVKVFSYAISAPIHPLRPEYQR
jgi:putative transposase